MIPCARAAVLVLAFLPCAGAAPKPPKAPVDPLADLAGRLDATPGGSLSKLAQDLRKSPEASVPLLVQALEAWEEEGAMPELALRAVNLAYGCNRYAKAFLLLPQVTGFPAIAADFLRRDPDAAPDNAWVWTQWWRQYGAGKPPKRWGADLEAQTRLNMKTYESIEYMKWRAAVGFAALRSADAKPLIESCLASKEPANRENGCLAAGLLGDRGLAKSLEAALGSDSFPVRTAAARAAGRLGDTKLVPPLRKLAGSAAHPERMAALKALLRLGEGDAAEALCRDLRSSEAAVRGAALQALTALPEPAFRERVDAAAKEVQGEAALELAAVRLLFGEKEALPVLLEGLQSPERPIQLKTVRLLLQAGGKEGRAIVAGHLKHYVNLAISSGVEAMRHPPLSSQNNAYGYRALRAYALLKCHVPAAEIQDDLDVLAKGPGDDSLLVYGLSAALMALEAGGRDKDLPRIAVLAERLAGLQNEEGSWGYGGAKMTGWDNSNTQFALLGLRAAARALKNAKDGTRIPEKVWQRGWDHFVSTQQPKGGYAGGWGYSGNQANGSMTCAGVCSLLVCHEALHEPKKGAKPDFEKLPPVAAGLGWLDGHFQVASNPESSFGFLYYYLYSIERTGDLAGVKEFGGRDWYREGALFLLRNQHASGGWGEASPMDTLYDTAFALLFLQRATRPLYDVGEAK